MLLLIVPRLVLATTVIQYDLPELVQRSDAVIRAITQDIQTQTIFTDVKAKVLKVYKKTDGLSISSTVSLRKLGGTVGDLSLTVLGSEEFKPGQESVLFLEKTDHGYFVILGMAQGKFDIVTDPTTSEKFVVRNVSQLHLLTPSSIVDTTSNKIPLTLFERKIKQSALEPKDPIN